MLNPFIIKKWIAIFLMPFIPVIGFYIGLITFGNLIYALGILLVCLLVSAMASNLLLYNPFRLMIEGKGLLVLDMTSTGIIRPYVFGISPPFIRGKIGAKWIRDIFNRETVLQIAAPKNARNPAIPNDKGGVTLELDELKYNKSRFALFHYPVLIYNSQLNTFLTKDFFSDLEKDSFAEHMVLYLKQVVEELSAMIREFGRYVIEQLKPQSNWWQSKWIIWIIIIMVGIIVAIFLPSIISTISGSAGDSVQQAVGGVAQNAATITPR